MSIPETNIYRCLTMCSTCPFSDGGKSMNLSKGRIADIKKTLLSNNHESFNCHKTRYELDEDHPNYNKMCAGAYEFLSKQGRPNILMRIAYGTGVEHPPPLKS